MMVVMPDKRVMIETAVSYETARPIRVASRHYLAAQHLWSALHNARLCYDLEVQNAGGESFNIEQRTAAMNSVLAAVAFMEAFRKPS